MWNGQVDFVLKKYETKVNLNKDLKYKSNLKVSATFTFLVGIVGIHQRHQAVCPRNVSLCLRESSRKRRPGVIK